MAKVRDSSRSNLRSVPCWIRQSKMLRVGLLHIGQFRQRRFCSGDPEAATECRQAAFPKMSHPQTISRKCCIGGLLSGRIYSDSGRLTPAILRRLSPTRPDIVRFRCLLMGKFPLFREIARFQLGGIRVLRLKRPANVPVLGDVEVQGQVADRPPSRGRPIPVVTFPQKTSTSSHVPAENQYRRQPRRIRPGVRRIWRAFSAPNPDCPGGFSRQSPLGAFMGMTT
jgi:hypothetical protein